MESREITLQLSVVPIERDELSQDIVKDLADLLIDYGLENGISIVLSLLEDKDVSDNVS